MKPWVLEAPEFYTRVNKYITEVGLPWDITESEDWLEEANVLNAALGDPAPAPQAPGVGEAASGKALDCACGWGRQAIALARLGWQVTATDATPSNLEFARRRASQAGASIDFQTCDMRDLAAAFHGVFDLVVCCYALYDLADDEDIQQAIGGMYTALKPGGRCYIRQRDMEDVLSEMPRHRFHGEKCTPGGRVFCIEDWEYESETHVIHLYAFLREDESRQDHFRWTTETLGYRKRAIRKVELKQWLEKAGFQPVKFLPQPEPWLPVEVVGERPVNS